MVTAVVMDSHAQRVLLVSGVLLVCTMPVGRLMSAQRVLPASRLKGRRVLLPAQRVLLVSRLWERRVLLRAQRVLPGNRLWESLALLGAQRVLPASTRERLALLTAQRVLSASRLWERRALSRVPLARKEHGQGGLAKLSASRATKPTGAWGVTPAPKDTREKHVSSARKTGTCSEMCVIHANRTRNSFFSSSSASWCLPGSSQRWYFQAK